MRIVLLASLLFSCSSGELDSGPTRGTLGGVCYGNNTCNSGLTCVSNVCAATGDDGGVVDTSVPVADSDKPPPDSAGVDAPAMDTAGPDTSAPVTFEGDIIPIFETSCGAKNNECHSRVAFHPKPESGCRGWLALENAPLGSKDPKTGAATGCADRDLYDRLTKLDAWECGDPYFPMFPRKKYVQPGDPLKSHLLNKMNGGPQCGVTNPMPKGGTAKPADIDKLTRWIKAGAPR